MTGTPQPPANTTPEHGLGTRLAEAGRHSDARVRIANVPVHRASTVLFDTLAQADEAGRRAMTGELHASTYGTVGTETTFALTDAGVWVLTAEDGGRERLEALGVPCGAED